MRDLSAEGACTGGYDFFERCDHPGLCQPLGDVFRGHRRGQIAQDLDYRLGQERVATRASVFPGHRVRSHTVWPDGLR